jgi:hypothetical protein
MHAVFQILCFVSLSACFPRCVQCSVWNAPDVSRIRVRPDWGGATHASVGRVIRVDEDGDPRIDFSPAGDAEWAIHRDELELVSASAADGPALTTTAARPLRVGDRVRVRSGVTPSRGMLFVLFRLSGLFPDTLLSFSLSNQRVCLFVTE